MTPDLACVSAVLLFTAANFRVAITDMTKMKIENGIILTMLAGYFILASIAGVNLASMAEDSLIALCVLVAGFILFMTGAVGAGDVKLAAVTALWMGPALTIPYIVYSAIAGGILTITIVAMRQFPLPSLVKGQSWAKKLHHKQTGIPYGVALAVAALILMPEADWFRYIL